MRGLCILLGGIYNVVKTPVKGEIALEDRHSGRQEDTWDCRFVIVFIK